MPWLDSTVTKRLKMLLNIPKSAPLVWNLVWDKRVDFWKKLIYIGGPLFYFLLPTDLISDFLPFVGQIDDLAVLFFMLERFVASCPEYIVKEYMDR